jgi:hypothetical protein
MGSGLEGMGSGLDLRGWGQVLTYAFPELSLRSVRKRVHSSLPVYSVRITKDYRAVGTLNGEKIVWFWAGTHAEYNGLLKFPVFHYATSRITAAIRGFCVGLLAPPQSLPKPSPPRSCASRRRRSAKAYSVRLVVEYRRGGACSRCAP